jgi:hypothetical protein
MRFSASGYRIKTSAVAFPGCVALALFWTRPLAANLSDRIAPDPVDPILNAWILWWNAQAVPLTSAWWQAPIFFPIAHSLALSEHLSGIAVLSTPIQLAGGSAILAYNVAFVLSYALSAWFAYLLAHRLTGSATAAWCAALAFGFSPYRAGQLSHIQVLTSQWMPAMLLALHGYVSTGHRLWLVAFGAAWLIQALSNGYYLLFIPVLLALWLIWFVDWRTTPARGIAILVAWAVSSLPLLPILLTYRDVHTSLGLSRTAGEIARYSATAASFLHAPPLLAFWPSGAARTPEDFLFPGLTMFVLFVLGFAAVIHRRGVEANDDHSGLRALIAGRSPLVFYLAATMVMWAFAFGPGAESDGILRWLRPYRWLESLPGYASLRVPSRFAMLASLCLAISSSLVVLRLQRAAGRWRSMLIALVFAGLVVDTMTVALPISAPPPRAVLPPTADAPVIELPPDDSSVNVAAMYRAMFHHHPLVNGYSGHVPPHYAILSLALRRGDTSPLLHFARGRPLLIIVNDRSDPNADFYRMVEQLPGVERIDRSGAGTLFRLPAQPRALSVGSDRFWSPALQHLDRARLTLDLGEARTIGGLRFAVRSRYEDINARLLIEISDDGREWRQAWLGWTGEALVAAALADPLVVPVELPLPDVRTRYLRIYPAPAWLAHELKVLAGS